MISKTKSGFIVPIKDSRILIVSCSAKKRKAIGKIQAKLLYTGTLLQTALRFANLYGMDSYILSAKYGIISSDEMIEWYNLKLTSPYNGTWPNKSGFYVGSQLYFGNAPDRLRPLIPRGLAIGKQIAFLKKLILTGVP